MNTGYRTGVSGAIWIAGILAARAVIINTPDGAGNTNSPPDAACWENVGKITVSGAPSSVTYVSNNWFLTASHVHTLDKPTAVLLSGVTYAIQSNSWTQMTNANGSRADLILFHVDGAVTNAPSFLPGAGSPDADADTVMIGHGRDRATGVTYWTTNSVGTWLETNEASAIYSGYKWGASTGTKRWGENTVDNLGKKSTLENIAYSVNGVALTTTVFRTTFDLTSTNDAQGATYDSGGGVFTQSDGRWYLSGIMITVGPFDRQPASTAVFGNYTYSANLGSYRGQISSVVAIPEPLGGAIFGLGSAVLILRYLRRRPR